jgi:protein-disulfide isomerase
LKNRIAVLAAALLLTFTASAALAQAAAVPSAPAPQTPSAAPAPPADPLPAANPKFFTATSPTVETVNSFLRVVWGFDTNRLWRVMAIQPTAAPGVTKVTVFVTEKAADAKVQSATFFVTPDGKHAIGAGVGVVPFGAKPFADTREKLQQRANGASRGADSKDLELVEFADLQCPHCKEAQSTMDQIVKDFPKAHVVFQLFPLVDIHPSAFKAAAYGICVQKQGNDAFFKYAAGVFDTQDGLSPTTDDTILKAAVKRAGLDADAIAACADTQATKDAVNADIKLAEDIGVDQTPLLSINGRLISITETSYDGVKQMIQYQATLDGVDSGATAETLAPHPPQPTLSNLP